MEQAEYNQMDHEKNVLDHTTLNVTLKELASRKESALAEAIRHILEHNSIPKPGLDDKPFDTSVTYYKVDLQPSEVERIIDIFLDQEAQHVDKHGDSTATAAFYTSLVEKWEGLL